MISNNLNTSVVLDHYKFDYDLALKLNESIRKVASTLNLRDRSQFVKCQEYPRRPQTNQLLLKLDSALIPCQYGNWLTKRGIRPSTAYSLSYDVLNLQDMLDLYIMPSDYIISEHGLKPIEGPVFTDRRNGQLAGVCVRNITTDLNYAAAEKYTVSNYGWFIYGYDDHKPSDTVYVVEGVFDAIVLNEQGYHAVGLATSNPTAIQLACLMHKFDDLILCLDNDIWGHVGSYIISKAADIDYTFTEGKDPGSYANKDLQFCNIELSESFIGDQIMKYNNMEDNELKRPLPYN